jgi:hypothetical protein
MSSKPVKKEEELRYRAMYSSGNFKFCCGGYEVGDLGIERVKPTLYDSWQRKEVKNPLWESASKDRNGIWVKALTRFREEMHEYPLMFNLVVGEETTEPLRQLLKEQEDVTLVHTWNNPNTNNLLEMYILTNGSNSDNDFSDDDDDF